MKLYGEERTDEMKRRDREAGDNGRRKWEDTQNGRREGGRDRVDVKEQAGIGC